MSTWPEIPDEVVEYASKMETWFRAKSHYLESEMNTKAMEAAKLAKVFHETYERLAPTFGYATRIESAKPWEQVPPTNKDLMIAVCQEIISKHFPEPSVPVSELKEMLSMEWMQNKTDVEQLQKHLEAIAWRPNGS